MAKGQRISVKDSDFESGEGETFEKSIGEAEAEPKFTVVKHVTRPTLSLKKTGTVVYFTVEEPFALDAAPQKDPTKKPATLLKVLNLRNGKPSQIVAPFILQKELGSYGDDEYVGRSFKVTVGDVVANENGVNRTRMLEVLEIKVD